MDHPRPPSTQPGELDQILKVTFDFNLLKSLLGNIQQTLNKHEDRFSRINKQLDAIHLQHQHQDKQINDIDNKLYNAEISIEKFEQEMLNKVQQQPLIQSSGDFQEALEELKQQMETKFETIEEQIEETNAMISNLQFNNNYQQDNHEQSSNKSIRQETPKIQEIAQPITETMSAQQSSSGVFEKQDNQTDKEKQSQQKLPQGTPVLIENSTASNPIKGDISTPKLQDQEKPKAITAPNTQSKPVLKNPKTKLISSSSIPDQAMILQMIQMNTPQIDLSQFTNQINELKAQFQKDLTSVQSSLQQAGKLQSEEFKKQIDQVRVYIRDQVDDMIKRDELVTSDLTSVVKSIEKQLSDKIAQCLRNTNDSQTKNQEQFTAMQKLIDKLKSIQQDKSAEVDNAHKKIRVLQQETDQIRGLHSMLMETGQKIEILEGKSQENKLAITNINKLIAAQPKQQVEKEGGLTGDAKLLESQIRDLRNTMGKRLDNLQEEVKQGFIKNNCEALEIKMVQRMNDITVALTRELADRRETKKHFRLVERQLKNIFSILIAGIKNIGLVSQNIITEASHFMLYQQIELIANHINGDLSFQQSLEGTLPNIDLVVIGEEMVKNTPSPRDRKHYASIAGHSIGEAVQQYAAPSTSYPSERAQRLSVKKFNDNHQQADYLNKSTGRVIDQSLQSIEMSLALKVPQSQRIANNSTSTSNDEYISTSINAKVTSPILPPPPLDPMINKIGIKKHQKRQPSDQSRPQTQNQGRNMFQFRTNNMPRNQLFSHTNLKLPSHQEDSIQARVNPIMTQRIRHVSVVDQINMDHSINRSPENSSTIHMPEIPSLSPIKTQRYPELSHGHSILNQIKQETSLAKLRDDRNKFIRIKQ